ncbi:MAG: preprotein translocase subunit SecG [Lentisphaeria bacterium]
MGGLLTFLVVINALILIVIVMMQRSKAGGGLGAVAGGQSEAMFGANAGNVLAKATGWLIGTFFVLTILLLIIGKESNKVESVIKATDAPVATEPATK